MYDAAAETWWARLVQATCAARKHELAVPAVVIYASSSASTQPLPCNVLRAATSIMLATKHHNKRALPVYLLPLDLLGNGI